MSNVFIIKIALPYPTKLRTTSILLLPSKSNPLDIFQYFFRVQTAIQNDTKIDVGIDQGKWVQSAKVKQDSNSGFDITCPSFPSNWNKFPSIQAPQAFHEGAIYNYLVSSCVVTAAEIPVGELSNEENGSPHIIDFSTAKPMKRGQNYVDSGRVFDVYDALNDLCMYCIKCTVEASYTKGKFYAVRVMINPFTGQVVTGECNCKGSSLGRCSHVSALLRMVLKFCNHTEEIPCTSKRCEWNQGRKLKEPKQIARSYASNRAVPSTSTSQANSIEDNNLTEKCNLKGDNLLKSLQEISANTKKISMWEVLLTVDYEDFELTFPRKIVLTELVSQLIIDMCGGIAGPIDITGGSQSDGLWHRFRRILITASVIKRFKTDKSQAEIYKIVDDHLWQTKFFENTAMRYGQQNEPVARSEYAEFFGFEVTTVGLCINSKYPGIGASPDALVFDQTTNSCGLLEIKCPIILEKLMPNELHKLSPQQRRSFCCTMATDNSSSRLILKRSHNYYYQIQTQMAITERLWCDFVVWTPLGFSHERITYNEKFIRPLLERASIFHQNILAPEYFEMRIPRSLPPFNLEDKFNDN